MVLTVPLCNAILRSQGTNQMADAEAAIMKAFEVKVTWTEDELVAYVSPITGIDAEVVAYATWKLRVEKRLHHNKDDLIEA